VRRPEQALHIAVARYLTVALRPPVWWSSIEHASKLGAVAAGMRRARGVKAGIPDIIIFWPEGKAGIELKSPTGSLSPMQNKTIDDWIAAGAHVAVCKHLEEVVEALMIWGIPLHAKLS
jgi:hypothetical protein